MRYPLKITFTCIVISMLSSCSFICDLTNRECHGFVKEFHIQSNPEGATLYNNKKQIGTTPTNLAFEFEINLDYPEKSTRYELVAKKKGFKPYTIVIRDSTHPEIIINLEPLGVAF